MLSLGEWQELGSPGIFRIRKNKGTNRKTIIFIQRDGAGYERRQIDYEGHIIYQWFPTIEGCGFTLTRQGTATTMQDLI